MSKFTTYLSLLISLFLLTGCNWTAPSTVFNPSPTTVPAPATKEFKSEFMKISLQIPQDWKVEDDKADLKLISPNWSKIDVSRGGTNWDNIRDLLIDLDSRRPNLTINESNIVTIDGNDAVVRRETFNLGNKSEEQKTYYLVVGGLFFTLSTSSPDLYDELDFIAQTLSAIRK